jgi:hypothetical protein
VILGEIASHAWSTKEWDKGIPLSRFRSPSLVSAQSRGNRVIAERNYLRNRKKPDASFLGKVRVFTPSASTGAMPTGAQFAFSSEEVDSS